MNNVISPARFITCVEHRLAFTTAGAGYSFDCSPDGEPLVPLNEAARANLAFCLAHSDEFATVEVEDFTREVKLAKVIRCDCGSAVPLWDSWSNGCDGCSREYNGSGQLLAPREQWGSEWVSQPEEDYGLY